MVIIWAKVSTQQLPRNIIIRAAAYDTVRKETFLAIQGMRRETMMNLKKKKVKLENKDTTTRRNPVSTQGIYLTAVKLEQYR